MSKKKDPFGVLAHGATPQEARVVNAMMRKMMPEFKIHEDIGWAYFCISCAKESTTLSWQEMQKVVVYHLRRIIRLKAKLGADVSSDEDALCKIKAFRPTVPTMPALAIGGAPKAVRSTGAKRTTGKRGPKATPKKKK